MLKPTCSLSLIGLRPPYLSLSSLLSPLSYKYIYLVHDRVTSNPIFSFLSFASLTWYQSAAREKIYIYFRVSPKAPPSCPATTPPSVVVALPPRRHPASLHLAVVLLAPNFRAACVPQSSSAVVLLAPSFRAACVPQSSSAVVRLAYLHLP